jgi:hypothetical protein
MVNLARYLKNGRATAIIHGSIYVSTHGRESEEAIILAYIFHETSTPSLTIKSGQRMERFRPVSKRRYDNLATLTAFIINNLPLPDTRLTFSTLAQPEHSMAMFALIVQCTVVGATRIGS